MIEQGSAEWFAAKCGKFSASRAADLMAKGRDGKPSRTRANLLAAIACERVTGVFTDSYHNGVMDRGNEVEASAVNAYILKTGALVERVGFMEHPSIPNVGCSPDGLVGDDGGLEIKSPSSAARHMEALFDGAHAVEHRLQVQFSLWVTGRRWWDVVSYDPKYPAGAQLAIVRLLPDLEMFAAFAGAIAAAEREVAEIIRRLNSIMESDNV